MSERYKKLYHLEHRLYAPGAPVLIEAGSLLLDQPSNSMLCQLCIRNIQSRPIKAMRAVVQMLDSRGNPLGSMEPVPLKGIRKLRSSRVFFPVSRSRK